MALKSDGGVWAWGRNTEGQLGDSTNANHNTPVHVSGLFDVIAIDAGDLHSLALKPDGTVWAWGLNSFGQLGNGSAGNTNNVPGQVIQLGGQFVSPPVHGTALPLSIPSLSLVPTV